MLEGDKGMKVKVKVDINANKIMQQRGIGTSNEFRKYLASQVKNFADPYVPMSSGSGNHFKNKAVVAQDGSTLTYPGPYAHYQYYGKVMAGSAPKHYTGEDLDYHGAPMRGARWIERMVADKKEDLERSCEAFIKRKAK